MDENLLGYALNSLDDATTRQVEAHLQAHPEARQNLDLLRQAMLPLAHDRRHEAAPAGLVMRTLARVAEQACSELPHAPPPAPRTLSVSQRAWWRRADVLVAACLLMTVMLLGVHSASHFREQQNRALCQDNLRQFHNGITAYHAQHGKYPNIAEDPSHQAAGMIAPLLHNAGTLPASASMRCAGQGGPLANAWSLDELHALSPDDFQKKSPKLIPSYGFTLGFRDEQGRHHPFVPEFDQVGSLLPLMADGPGARADLGNSPNHGGRGQNVLFHDGHVRFLNSRHAGIDGDDIYLNKAHKVAAGLDRCDTVLGHSAAQP